MKNSIIKIAFSYSKKTLRLFLFVMVVSVPILMLALAYPALLNSIASTLSKNAWSLRCIRWSLILAFFLFWPYLSTWIGARIGASKEQIAYWQAERMRLTIWLVLFELLICDNLILKLI